ncbi:hypothetical protein ABPG75_004899 [Micractinium tetrahymenae]
MEGGIWSVGAAWEYCSSNRLYLLPNASQYIDIGVGCPFGFYDGDCDAQFDTMQAYTRRAYNLVKPQLKRNHAWFLWVMPTYLGDCGWGGRGKLAGLDLWVVRDDLQEPSTLMHETGHTQGLRHAAVASSALVDPSVVETLGVPPTDPSALEYGDFSSAMSATFSFPLCFNLPEQRLLGWQQPTTLDASVLKPGTWYAATMPDTFADPKAGIRINPNWLQPNPRKYLYVSYAPALGLNRGMDPAFSDRVYVHWHNDVKNSMNVINVARLKPGQRWASGSLSWFGGDNSLVVHFHSASGLVENKLLAAVSICRRGPGQTCALGKPGPPSNDIYSFAPPQPTYRLFRGVDWDVRPYDGQWRRFYATATAEDCAAACFYLPTCYYFTFLEDEYWETNTGLEEQCFLGARSAYRATPVKDDAVSGYVIRPAQAPVATATSGGMPPQKIPRVAKRRLAA